MPINERQDERVTKSRYGILLRSISLVIVVAFLMQDLVYAQGGTPLWSQVVEAKSQDTKNQDAQGTFNKIAIPYDSGLARKVVAKGTQDVVINIQDAHSKLGAQESITRIIDNLVKNYNLNLITLEGATDTVDLSLIRSFPVEEAKKRTGEYLLKEGRISAGEFYSLISKDAVSLYGAEDPSLYKENVDVFKELIDNKLVIRQELRGLKKAISELERKIYPSVLQELTSHKLLHKNGDIKFTEYWSYFSKLAQDKGVDYRKHTNLKKLAQAVDLEGEIDFRRAGIERDYLIEELGEKLPKSELERLVLQALQFKQSKITPGAFHYFLSQTSQGANIDPLRYKNIILYSQYVVLYENIDLIAIFDEVELFENELRDKLFTNDDERAQNLCFEATGHMREKNYSKALGLLDRAARLEDLAKADVRYPVRLFVETPGLKAALDGHVVDPRAPKEFEFSAAINGDGIAAVPVKAGFRIKGKGRDVAIEAIEASAGQSDLAGSARVSLAGRIPEISASLRSRRLDLRELIPATKKSDAVSTKGGRMFPDDPLPLDALRVANAHVGYKIETAVLPGGATVRDVDAMLALKDGRLVLPIALAAAGGTAKGEVTMDGSSPAARIAFRLTGDKVDWGRLLADSGQAQAVWDSKAEVAIDARGAGNSVRAIMASLEGDVRLVLGPGRIGNKYFDLAGADALTEIATALNPFAKSDEFSELKCAVARFKVTKGVAETRDGLAIETGKMTVSGGGRVDLGAETLDLAFKPEARQGFGVGLGNLVGRVRVQGTFAEPGYGLDPLAAVTGTVGAVTSVVTGGISAITGALTGDRAKPETSPCQVALGLAPPPTAAQPRTEPRPAPAQPERKNEGLGGTVRGIGEGIGRGLKDILGR